MSLVFEENKLLPARRIKSRRYLILAFLIPLLFFVSSLNGKWASSGVPLCVQGMQYSMWKNHKFDLGEEHSPIVPSVDIVIFKGKYYCPVAPGLAFLSLPFAAHGYIMDGGNLDQFGYSLIMVELFLAITASFATLFVYKICRLYARRVPSLLASITFALATTVWPMATVIYVNDASVLFSTAAVYLVMKHSSSRGRGREVERHVEGERENESQKSDQLFDLTIAGLSIGLASFIEYITILFAPVLAGYLFFKIRSKHVIFLFLLAASVGPIMHFIYNYSVFEDPFFFPEQLIGRQFSLDGLALHAVAYIISPYRGLILLSPVLILGMYKLFQMIKTNRYRVDAILFISLFLIILLPYSAWDDWAGGPSYGPRFLISVIPFMVVPIAILLSENRSTFLRIVFLLLFAISSFIQAIGALTTAFGTGRNEPLVYEPSAQLHMLLEGNLPTWFFFRIGMYHGEATQSFFQLFATLLILCSWSIVAYFTIKSICVRKNNTPQVDGDAS